MKRSEQSLSFPVRFVTATSLFDGHDASINIMRRLLQLQGAEVIHLGHNRSVEDIVETAIQEDAQGIAISSYQGGHNEFFKYMIDLLKEKNSEHIRVFGGGGGVIIPQEIKDLMNYGVERIYSPDDGRELGLEGMIADMVQRATYRTVEESFQVSGDKLSQHHWHHLAQTLTWVENHPKAAQSFVEKLPASSNTPILGITGTGGAGKSCLTDELVRRFQLEFADLKVAVLSVDPSKRRTGGALLGDRIRMNSLNPKQVYMRSVATRRANLATSESLQSLLKVVCSCQFDLVILETAGIGQSDSEITDLVDLSMYVMTPEFGAATQLEKIDMLDYADVIVLNKFDKQGSEDALNAVRKQYRRNHNDFDTAQDQLPVFGSVASQFNDAGTNQLYDAVIDKLMDVKSVEWKRTQWHPESRKGTTVIVPPEQKDYLRQIANTVRTYKKHIAHLSDVANQCFQLYGALQQVGFSTPEPFQSIPVDEAAKPYEAFIQKYNELLEQISPPEVRAIQAYWKESQKYCEDQYTYQVGEKTFSVDNRVETLSGLKVPKVAVPRYHSWGNILRWVGLENFPGTFPYTAGVFPFKRAGEDPTRMFAGEGGPERTNRRFHYLSSGQSAARLSTAFDSVTLYGSDPHERPDIYGKVGNAGVSICTVDDMKRLYSGVDLSAPTTSVSMTINGPAPIILAFFLNAAIDQAVEQYLVQENQLDEAKQKIIEWYKAQSLPVPEYRTELPDSHNGLGLQTLGMSGEELVSKEVYQKIKSQVLHQVRGTVQADILKEDQAQNTCIFSTEFALKMMGDIQEYFTQNKVRYFYSVSISGYHIAEAGANPISQVAFTLANGFTLIEYYLSRGLAIDDFCHNLSFFFSNGMDPEYAVIGRVARRIFAVALREKYGANSRSQKLKYHIQTSGRSLHAQEIDFNDIRTTLQALYAIYDNCNSLHTNAYDEAITTPTEESVRRALAIQLIINRELGLANNENPLQGSFVIEELTDLVEEAILSEFIRISDRGGVLGAMETMYQRNKIQEESLYYEKLKHSGELPIIGVNTFLNPNAEQMGDQLELARSTNDEKDQQLASLANFQKAHASKKEEALGSLREACLEGSNTFEALMDVVKYCSLGQITEELYRLGGQYRRNM